MPVPFILGALIGGVAGFVVGDGVDATSRIVRWGVVGGIAFLVAKQAGVLK